MFTLNRNLGFTIAGDRVLVYAALFLVCSLISFFGAGNLAALAFLPAALAIEVIGRMRAGESHSDDLAR